MRPARDAYREGVSLDRSVTGRSGPALGGAAGWALAGRLADLMTTLMCFFAVSLEMIAPTS